MVLTVNVERAGGLDEEAAVGAVQRGAVLVPLDARRRRAAGLAREGGDRVQGQRLVGGADLHQRGRHVLYRRHLQTTRHQTLRGAMSKVVIDSSSP